MGNDIWQISLGLVLFFKAFTFTPIYPQYKAHLSFSIAVVLKQIRLTDSYYRYQ